MSEKIRQVAQRIREIRKIAGVSVNDLARELKISPEEYGRYESGEVDIPVSLLYEVAQRFNIELTVLLTGEEPRMRTYSLVRSGTGASVDRRKEYRYQDLAYNFVHKKSEIFLVTVEPKKKEKPHFYAHPGQEFTYVLEGKLKLVLDGHEVVLAKGDSLYFDSGRNHALIALGGKKARFLAVIL